MIKKWETIRESKAGDYRIFDIYNIRRRHPELNQEGEFVVINSNPWVNIIPVTNKNDVVFVEQYRQGTDEITLEIPGGLINLGETPQEAAERECIEETGYCSENKALLIGTNHPNPAFLNNQCYSFVWFGCNKLYTQKLDINEDIEVRLIPIPEIKTLIVEGKINHSIVLTAFLFYFLKFGFH